MDTEGVTYEQTLLAVKRVLEHSETTQNFDDVLFAFSQLSRYITAFSTEFLRNIHKCNYMKIKRIITKLQQHGIITNGIKEEKVSFDFEKVDVKTYIKNISITKHTNYYFVRRGTVYEKQKIRNKQELTEKQKKKLLRKAYLKLEKQHAHNLIGFAKSFYEQEKLYFADFEDFTTELKLRIALKKLF
jgi:hypothetical protein